MKNSIFDFYGELKMKNYFLRNIPIDLYKRIQHAAIDRGCTIGALLLMAVEEFLSKDGK